MIGTTGIAPSLPGQTRSGNGMSAIARLFIALVVFTGLGTLIDGAIHQSSKNIAEFICYLGIAVLASRLR